MPQEFLASFAVDIDEGGVNRLQGILARNRELAEDLASAIDAARASMEGFIRSASQDLAELPFFRPGNPAGEAVGNAGTFAVDLDFGAAAKQLEAFLAGAKKQLRLSADGSGIVAAVSSAISRARSMLAGAGLKLTVKTETDRPGPAEGAGPVRYLSSGGRFSSPTKAEIAEDGNPEYVIPVTKKNEAVPLVRSLLAELPEDARNAVEPPPAGEKPPENPPPETGTRDAEPRRTETREPARPPAENRPESLLPEINIPDRKQKPTPAVPSFTAAVRPVPVAQPVPEAGRTAARLPLPAGTTQAGRRAPASSGPEKTAPPLSGTNREPAFFLPASGTEQAGHGFSSLLAALPEYLSAAPAAAIPPVTQNMTTSNISAPVNIRVEAAGADPEEIGKSIYNTAEQYLLRTLQGVNA